LNRTYFVLQKVFDEEPLFIGRKALSFPYNTVPDEIEGIGPMGGLFTALKYVDTDFIFLTACDMPFINEKVLHYMKISLREDTDIYIPHYSDGMIEPLFAFYHKRIFPFVEKQIENRDYRLRALLKNTPDMWISPANQDQVSNKNRNRRSTYRVQILNEREIEFIDPELLTFFNINTRNEFDKAQGLLEHEVR